MDEGRVSETVGGLEVDGAVGSSSPYTPYEGLYLANQKSRKLEVFVWKLDGSHFQFYRYFDRYCDKIKQYGSNDIFLLI